MNGPHQNPQYPPAEAFADHRNVIDHFKYWHHDAIRAALDTRRAPYVVVLENFAHDFNISTAIRNANAFVAREVWITGRRRYDRRGAQGTHRYEHVHHAATTEEVLLRLRAEGMRVVAVDNLDGAASLMDYRWHPRSVMVFGQEQIGVSPQALALAHDLVYIPQYGSTRSINVGTASGIAMFSYASAVMGPPAPWDQAPATDQ